MILERRRGVNTGVYRFSARGIRVTRALQILSESYTFFPLPSYKSHLSFLLASFRGVSSHPVRVAHHHVIRSTKARRATCNPTPRGAMYARLRFWRGINAASCTRRLKYHIPLSALSPPLSLGKVNTIPLVPYVLFSSFLCGTISRTITRTDNKKSKLQDRNFCRSSPSTIEGDSWKKWFKY